MTKTKILRPVFFFFFCIIQLIFVSIKYCRKDLGDYLNNASNKEEIMKDFAQVIIYNKHLSVTQIEEVEAYTLDSLFSDIGEHYTCSHFAKDFCCNFKMLRHPPDPIIINVSIFTKREIRSTTIGMAFLLKCF